jgi:hypothetical protein
MRVGVRVSRLLWLGMACGRGSADSFGRKQGDAAPLADGPIVDVGRTVAAEFGALEGNSATPLKDDPPGSRNLQQPLPPPVSWVEDTEACSGRPNEFWCTPAHFKLAGVPAAPLDPCAMLRAKGVSKILFAGDSFVRHAYQSTAILLAGNFRDGGIQCNENCNCQRECQYGRQFSEKYCRFYVASSGQDWCGGNVKLILKEGRVVVPSESDVRGHDIVVWGLGNHPYDSNYKTPHKCPLQNNATELGPWAGKRGFCNAKASRQVLANRVIYLDTHAHPSWFPLLEPLTSPLSNSDGLWYKETCSRGGSLREHVTQYSAQMPTALQQASPCLCV